MLEWAKREVEIACKRENPDRKEGEFDYGCACYESALKAFNCLMEDNHSGMSIGFTKSILNRLIDGKCLTPIEDTEDIWDFRYEENGEKKYQCNRMYSLFKYVREDGTVSYHDVDRFVMYVKGSDIPWHNGFIQDIAQQHCPPITFPYIPESKPFTVYCEECLTDPKNGDYDTVGVLYGIDPDGNKFEINRYFKDGDRDMIEIDKEEYEARKLMDKERREKMKGE